MLKAIWPSTARIPNHLSPSANITTVGEFNTDLIIVTLSIEIAHRNDVLLLVLAHSASLSPGLAA
jgi:hypothetical protein